MAHPNLTDDIEKLLEIAEAAGPEIKFEDTQVEKFIHEAGIVDGEAKIPTYIIYYEYAQWQKNKKKLLPRVTFFKQFKKHFTRVQTRDGKGYLLDPEAFDMTQEGFFKARALLRRERHVRKKEKQKKPGKVSGS